jgi:PTS system nitrogen regulatory IIA component
MKITDHLTARDIIPELRGESKEAVMAELVSVMTAHHSEVDAGELLQVLQDRERLGSTGIGDGIAIPHGKMTGATSLLMALGRKRQGIPFDAIDGRLVQLVFLLVAPAGDSGIHLRMLARISRILHDPAVRHLMLEADDSSEALLSIMRQQDERP